MAIHLTHPVHLLALGFGSGLAPRAPGTAGTLAGIPIALGLSYFSPAVYLSAIFLGTVLGAYICGVTAKAMGVHDHPSIVWDEIIGYTITMFAAPGGWIWWIVGFAYFRLFDIWKPYPIRLLDKQVEGGWGIMLDDVLAGVYAWIALQLTIVAMQQAGTTFL
jgi:phosphatidylglycerophosphatase A